jgi:membrane protease YdiL (CAAX protease family)
VEATSSSGRSLYATQFFTLEFFFRGFLVFAGREAMGSSVIVAMVVPYCMIHFGKPWAEALAAILAGVVLGTLSLKTRSIWSGFLIHVTVAVSMDLAALLQTRGLPGNIHLPPSWGW